MIKIAYPFISLFTKNTALIFEVKEHKDVRSDYQKDKKYICLKYYGLKSKMPKLEPSKPLIGISGSNSEYNYDGLITNSVGDGNQNEPSIIIDSQIESYTNRFYFDSAKSFKGGKIISGPHARNVNETLEIVEKDKEAKIELHHYYSVIEKLDVIVSKKEVVNKGESIKINRLASLHLPLFTNDLTIYSFDGSWAFERTRHETKLNNGIYIIDSKCGSSSAKHNPFFELKDNENNLFYGFNLIYSGNHKEIIEACDFEHHGYVQVGINDYLFAVEIKKNQSFISPEAIMIVTENLDEITTSMHQFTLNQIIRPEYKNQIRPIVFNTWEGTVFNINEKEIMEMAELAKKLGIEELVMDDGWFKNRINETKALGDWVVDKNKFPNGLKTLVNKIKNLGLKFGLWFEPEMISPNSDLYRAHPEYASKIINREPMPRRHQLILDLTNPKVVDYLFKTLSKIFDEIKPDYIKWDYNRFMTDNYSCYGTKKGEFMYRYIQGVYKLMEKLTEKYPNILFESCSSGGCRYDLGILYYMPQTWGSDDTNSYFRTFISCGTLAMYPQNTFGAHVSRDGSPKPEVTGTSSFEDRFNINAIGCFGYELDIRKLEKFELDVIKEQIKFYKKHRELFQFGNYYVVDNCFDNENYYSYTVVNNKKTEAIMTIVETKKNVKKHIWKAKGLNPNYNYLIRMRAQYNLKESQIYQNEVLGQDLMEKGIDLGSLYSTIDKEKFNGIYSRMLYLKKVTKKN